jgi:hypothetical protein
MKPQLPRYAQLLMSLCLESAFGSTRLNNHLHATPMRY